MAALTGSPNQRARALTDGSVLLMSKFWNIETFLYFEAIET